MAQYNFMDLTNLTLYDSLIKNYIDTEDAKSIKYITYDTATNPTTLSFWKVDPTGESATAAYTITLPDASTLMTKVSGSHQNEVAILDANGQVTYASLAISDVIRKSTTSGATFTEGQVAVFEGSNGNVVKGLTLADVATSGDAEDVAYDNTTSGLTATDVQAALDELAEASEGGVASKTVYITETAGGSGDLYSKRYGIYQGSEGSSAEPVPAEKLTDIDIPKDMVVESGSVVNIVFKSSDNTLHEGTESGPDVTEAIKGSDTPTAADAGKYIKLVIANTGSDALYIKATDLVDIYTGGTTSSGTISISNGNVITFDLDSGVSTLINNSVQKGWSSTTPTSGNIMAFGANGVAVDGGIAVSDINTDTFAPIAEADIRALFSSGS